MVVRGDEGLETYAPRKGGQMKKAKYKTDLPRRVYQYFVNYTGLGAPSLTKFARECGITLADVRRFEEGHSEFRRALAECSEIRRDYLIDNALGKKQDGSFTKFILQAEYGMGESQMPTSSQALEVTVEVIDGET